MKHKLYMLIIASTLSISCSRGIIKTINWLPPKDTNGNVCVQKCFKDRVKCSKTAAPSTCLLNKITKTNQSSPIHNAQSYNAKTAKTLPKNCSVSPECMAKYKECFLQCGGQLIIHKETESTV